MLLMFMIIGVLAGTGVIVGLLELTTKADQHRYIYLMCILIGVFGLCIALVLLQVLIGEEIIPWRYLL